MDRDDYFPKVGDKSMAKFKTICRAVDLSDESYASLESKMKDDCQSWKPSGTSLIAQHPYRERNANKTLFVQFGLSYTDFFFEDGSVRFKFKSNQKRRDNIVNGNFVFRIDGEPQVLNTGVEYSDVWFEVEFNFEPGTHKLEWIYKKFDIEDTSDDLSAEIEFIEVRGVKTMITECQVCEKGIPDFDKARCLECPRDQYLDESTESGDRCKACPKNYFSPSGSIGAESCQ